MATNSHNCLHYTAYHFFQLEHYNYLAMVQASTLPFLYNKKDVTFKVVNHRIVPNVTCVVYSDTLVIIKPLLYHGALTLLSSHYSYSSIFTSE